MDKAIQFLVIAELLEIDGVKATNDDNHPHVCIVADTFGDALINGKPLGKGEETFTITKERFPVAYQTQSWELLFAQRKIEDFVNVWLRDYAGDFHKDDGSPSTIKVRNAKFLSRSDDVWIEDVNAQEQEVYIFGSSYGGDGIRIKVKTEKWFE